jgi:hypothetical protein
VDLLRPSTKFEDDKAYMDITWDDLFPKEPYRYTGKSIKDDSHALDHLKRNLFPIDRLKRNLFPIEPDRPQPDHPVKSIQLIIIDSDDD